MENDDTSMAVKTMYADAPGDWKQLQSRVATIFRELGCSTEEQHLVHTVRGPVEVDVYVIDATRAPSLTYICECKHWKKRVPKSVVHSLRTVLSDAGAHAGYLISSRGYQRGALQAAASSNTTLCSWVEFQALFFDRWLAAMRNRLAERATTVFDYMDILDDRVNAVLGKSREIAESYAVMFQKFSCFIHCSRAGAMLNDLSFPVQCIDPRGELNDVKTVVFEHPREYFDVLLPEAERAADVYEHFLRHHENR